MPDFSPTALRHIDALTGAWAIEAEAARALEALINRTDLVAHILASSPAERRELVNASAAGTAPAGARKIALIDVDGTLSKYGSSMSQGSSYLELARALDNASRDATVDGILLRFDSPGGNLKGLETAARAISAAKESKPVVALVEDLTASAAYWLASQADNIYAIPGSRIGSIGAFAVVEDWSAAAASKGVKVHVVKSAKLKGAGTPGTPITEEQLSVLQNMVNESHEEFVSAIMTGRGLTREQVDALATGEMFNTSQAVEKKLIDGIRSLDDVLSDFPKPARRAGNSNPKGARATMSEVTTGAPDGAQAQQPASTVASYEQIKAVCKGAPADFICAQLERKATVEQARDAWTDALSVKVIELEKVNADLLAKGDKPGVDAVDLGKGAAKAGKDGAASASASDETDAVAEWNAAVKAKVDSGLNKQQAISAVARENKDLHAAYISAVNKR